MRTKVIRIHETGGPEALQVDEVELKAPAIGEVLLRQTAIGVNFTDTYVRNGLYPMQLPCGIGFEAAGVVEAVGAGVDSVKPGDRVAYAGGPIGAYAEARLYPADRLVSLPSWIDDLTTAALLLKGMTAEYLLKRACPVKKGDWILYHAAAGATGGIVCQWAKALGAHVIGSVGSDSKIPVAEANGCEKVVVTSDPRWPSQVRDITGGVGVRVVYDVIGKDTFDGSLSCIARLGTMVSYGSASGPVPPFNIMRLNSHGSINLLRPSLWDYVAARQDLMESAASLFEAVHHGEVRATIARTFPLTDAAEAHRALESRSISGSILLLP